SPANTLLPLSSLSGNRFASGCPLHARPSLDARTDSPHYLLRRVPTGPRTCESHRRRVQPRPSNCRPPTDGSPWKHSETTALVSRSLPTPRDNRTPTTGSLRSAEIICGCPQTGLLSSP